MELGSNEDSSSSGADTKQTFSHTETIRTARFDASCRSLLTCGDDKLVLLWDCETGKCLARAVMGKKCVDAMFIDHEAEGHQIIVADKTGNVFGLERVPSAEEGAVDVLQPTFLIGHCSTITAMLNMWTRDPHTKKAKHYIATSDVEGKVRVSHFPTAYDIVSFCFGHTSFVTGLSKATFKNSDGSSSPLLISGGGDGSVRLWEPLTGKNLDTFWPMAHMKNATGDLSSHSVGQKRSRESQDPASAGTVGSLSASPAHNLVALGVVGSNVVEVLRVSDGVFRPLDSSVISLPGKQVHLSFDPKGRLWVAMQYRYFQ